jgi:hypothetical protein
MHELSLEVVEKTELHILIHLKSWKLWSCNLWLFFHPLVYFHSLSPLNYPLYLIHFFEFFHLL